METQPQKEQLAQDMNHDAAYHSPEIIDYGAIETHTQAGGSILNAVDEKVSSIY